MRLPTPDPTVIFQKLEEGAVLFSPVTELYFGLNEAGALIWLLLPPVLLTLDELVRRLTERFPDVSPDTLRQDATELLDALAAEGLVRPDPAPGARTPS